MPQTRPLRRGLPPHIQIGQAALKTLKKPIVIAVIQRKGGVGKTTIMHHLATGLTLSGYNCLAIEADDNPRLRDILEGLQTQRMDAAQTTYGLLTDPQYGVGGFAHTVKLDRLWEGIPHLSIDALNRVRSERGWGIPGTLQFVPGSERVKEVEDLFARRAAEGTDSFKPALQLQQAIGQESAQRIVLIDAPPSLTHIWTNIVNAATHIVIPVDFDFASPGDYDRTYNAYVGVRRKIEAQRRNPAKLLGVVLNKFNGRNEDHVEMLNAYTQEHDEIVDQRRVRVAALITAPVLGIIPLENDLINRAAKHHRSLHQYAPLGEPGIAAWKMVQNVMQALELS
jgi:cellulose biosynthesis protein BcsQ